MSGDFDLDEVCDDADNCPVDANTDQADADLDRIGDVCEVDSDSDGVVDDLDLCAGTPIGSLFNDDGCSGPQLIERACGLPQASPRGPYIACVVLESKRAQREGLITRIERAQIIRNAARGNVGRPRCRR